MNIVHFPHCAGCFELCQPLVPLRARICRKRGTFAIGPVSHQQFERLAYCTHCRSQPHESQLLTAQNLPEAQHGQAASTPQKPTTETRSSSASQTEHTTHIAAPAYNGPVPSLSNTAVLWTWHSSTV